MDADFLIKVVTSYTFNCPQLWKLLSLNFASRLGNLAFAAKGEGATAGRTNFNGDHYSIVLNLLSRSFSSQELTTTHIRKIPCLLINHGSISLSISLDPYKTSNCGYPKFIFILTTPLYLQIA
jgi:hypothetical protein